MQTPQAKIEFLPKAPNVECKKMQPSISFYILELTLTETAHKIPALVTAILHLEQS